MSDELSGTLTADGHRLSQRVYYEDTDFSGVVYHARYLHFLERGRTDYLRCLGIQQGGAGLGGEEGLAFVVRHMELDFQAPARMDDVVEISTTSYRVGGAKLVLDQTIESGGLLLIQARVTIAVVNGRGRPRRLPDDVSARFASGSPS
ncbi:MAG: tol-pal system-associated acyl-CoA thioesterase [Alphaproteobacteria bacterium]|nr:tol-pal system-associated acyl-CoA thioesterase [Alphaproteobacteria bacterium]